MTPPSSRSAITRLGGVATWTELIADVGRVGLRRALDSGSIIRVGRGRYVAAATSEHRSRAHALTGLVSHLSAAVHHGWKVKCVPAEAWVTVPRTRHVRAAPEGVRIHWADLPADEASAGVTHPLRTVLDCARVLPFDEALALADSALRSGTVSKEDLRSAAASTSGPGSAQIRRVTAHADGRAANPFESVLRALALEAGLDLTPQLVIAEPGFFAVADLGSERLRLVVEAEGFEHHGTRAGLRADCTRHTGFALHGWTSLRFTYEDVMYAPEWVVWVLRSWLTGEVTTPPSRKNTA
ncbi:MAG TPA: DUF559 domain-containing protein [Propionibacteriaceae bacterium]